MTSAIATPPPSAADPLSEVLGRARLQVLRATSLIAFLIAGGTLVGSIADFTPSGRVRDPATPLAVLWCALWALAAIFPSISARWLVHWRTTGLGLALATAATVAVTGGIESPLMAVSMYGGWVASVVVRGGAALAVSLLISASVFAGYLLAGNAVADVLTGPYRYGAVSSAVLPIFTGLVGVLLATVANTIFSRLVSTLEGLRAGMPATTPGLTALLAGRPVLELAAASPKRHGTAASMRLTEAEREVVRLLAAGHTPQQIAQLRDVEESTVRSQIKTAKRKTGARTLAQLALCLES